MSAAQTPALKLAPAPGATQAPAPGATQAPAPGAAGGGRGVDEDRPTRLADPELLRRLWGFVRPYRRLLIGSLLLLPVVAGLDLLQPMLIKLAIDQGIARGATGRIDLYAVLFLLSVALAQGTGYYQLYTMQLAGQRATQDLRNAAFRHLLSLRPAYFDRQPTGRLLTRVTSDVDSLNELFAGGVINLVGDAVVLVGIMGILLTLDLRLGLLCLVSAPVLAASAEVFRRLLRTTFRENRRQLAEMNAFLSEHVAGMGVIQAFRRQGDVLSRFDRLNDGYRRSTFRGAAYDAALFAWVEALSTYVVALILWVAAGRVGGGALSFGALVAFYKYVDRFFVPLRELSAKYAMLQSALAAAERLFGLLDVDERLPEPAERVPAEALQREIRFDDVSFSYGGAEQALSRVSFRVPRGKKVAIVGHTGSGKSTVARLLLRQYDASAGSIEVDGIDVRAVSLQEHRRRFALVLQDVQLFAGTVADNIALSPTPDLGRVRAAARAVQLDELLERRGGLQAPVHERGANFSQGERQLLSFARALYRDPEVLVLDEATASVDSETEARLQAALDVLLSGRTAVVIAHRLSTIRACDEILVMHKGRLTERGSHDQLLSQGGLYRKLYELQFAAAHIAGGAAR